MIHSVKSFRVEAPNDWILTSTPKFEAVLLAPATLDVHGANLSITFVPLENGLTFERFFINMGLNQSAQYPEFRIQQEGPIQSAHHQGMMRNYTWQNTMENLPINQRQIFYPSPHTAHIYIVTATRRNDIEVDKADILDTIFLQIAHSLMILPDVEA